MKDCVKPFKLAVIRLKIDNMNTKNCVKISEIIKKIVLKSIKLAVIL